MDIEEQKIQHNYGLQYSNSENYHRQDNLKYIRIRKKNKAFPENKEKNNNKETKLETSNKIHCAKEFF